MKKMLVRFIFGVGVIVYSSNIVSADWVQVNVPWGDSSIYKAIYSLAARGSTVFAGTDSGVFLSTNDGSSWTSVANSGFTNTIVSAFTVSDSTIVAGTSKGGVFLSNNNDTSWTAVDSGLPNTFMGMGMWGHPAIAKPSVSSLLMYGNTILAGTSRGGVFRSIINNETNWIAVNSGLTDIMYDITSLAACGNAVFAGTLRSGIYLSTDNGTSWSAVNSGLTNNLINSLAVSGSNIFAGTRGGVFLSSNNGTSWGAANSGLANNYIQSLAVSGSNIFAAINGGFYLSTSNGNSWEAFDAGLPGFPGPPYVYIQSIAVSDSNIFAAINYNKIWRRSLSEISSVNTIKPQHELSKQVTLKILSSSRTNRYVTIEFSLPNSQKVLAKIYNLSGHEIASLVNENPGQGSGRFHWNTRNVAPGCYTVRIQAGSNIYTKSIAIFQ